MEEILQNEYVIGGVALLVGWLLPNPKFSKLRNIIGLVASFLGKIFKPKDQ